MAKKEKLETKIEAPEVEVVVAAGEEIKEIEPREERKIKVVINGVSRRGRASNRKYRPSGVYVLRATEAEELIKDGVATMREDPCYAKLTFED